MAALAAAFATVNGLACYAMWADNKIQPALHFGALASFLTFNTALWIGAHRDMLSWQRIEEWKPDEEMTVEDYEKFRAWTNWNRSITGCVLTPSNLVTTHTLALIKTASFFMSLGLLGAYAYNGKYPTDQCSGGDDRRAALVTTLGNGEATLSTRLGAPYAFGPSAPLFRSADYILPTFQKARDAAHAFCSNATEPDAIPTQQKSLTLEIAP